MKRFLPLCLLLTFTKATESEKTTAVAKFNPFQTKDCHSCKAKYGEDAYYCNDNNQVGYCCPHTDPSFYGCRVNEEVNRVCSSETEASEFYFKACMNVNNHELCGHTDIQMSLNEEEITVKDIPYTGKTACVWEFWDRVDGFKKFGGQRLEFTIEEMENMNVYVAKGENYKKMEMAYSTEAGTLKVGEPFEVEVEERVFIAAVPKSATPASNYLKLVFIEKEEEAAHGIDEHTHHILIQIEIGIIGGGLILSALIVIVACFIRRFQRWQELQRVALSEEDEEPYIVDLSARGDSSMRKGDGGDYS